MATRPTGARPPLRASLRTASAAPHARLDAAFAVRTGSVSGYAALLQVLHRFHTSADPLLTAWAAGSPAAPTVTVPEREAALRRDLLALDVAPLPPADLSVLPRDAASGLLTAGAGLGLLYVVAGSSVGARVLLRQLPPAVPVQARAGLAEGAGEASAQLWRTTVQALAAVASSAVTEDATRSCRLAFDVLCACSEATDVALAG